MIKAVIFDLDGTIGDTLPLCIKAFQKALEPLIHRRISDQEVINTFGPSEEGTVEALASEYYQQGLHDYWNWYANLHYMCPKPFEGIVEILDYLKNKKINIAMVTGKALKSCQITLKYFGIEHYFEMIETGSPVKQRKIEGMQAVLKAHQLSPDEAVYIGDAVSDVICAKKVGIPCISVLWGSLSAKTEIAAEHPEYIFEQVAELKNFLINAIDIEN